jgi:hypothetical protein
LIRQTNQPITLPLSSINPSLSRSESIEERSVHRPNALYHQSISALYQRSTNHIHSSLSSVARPITRSNHPCNHCIPGHKPAELLLEEAPAQIALCQTCSKVLPGECSLSPLQPAHSCSSNLTRPIILVITALLTTDDGHKPVPSCCWRRRWLNLRTQGCSKVCCHPGDASLKVERRRP